MALFNKSRNNFSTALKIARKFRGLSQEDFSLVSSRTYVSTLERGLKSPTLKKVEDFSEVLGIHPLTLVALAYLSSTRPGDVNALIGQVTEELVKISDAQH